MTHGHRAPSRAPVSFRIQLFDSPIPVVMVPPRPIAADPARSIIGPDDPAVAVRIIVVWIIIRRCVVEPPMEVMMPVEVGPVGVAVAAMMKSMEAAVTIASAVNGKTAGSESAAVKSATTKTAAMEAATVEAAAMESPPWPPPPPPCRTTVVSPSAACFAAGTAAGLASDSASARCDIVASANIAAAATPKRRTTPHPGPVLFIADPSRIWTTKIVPREQLASSRSLRSLPS